ncbi:MAG: hypothetical protein JWO59_707 [Chloroflexi bacterium]|nr:hypothetical protein [Chloroflexota bacterium]
MTTLTAPKSQKEFPTVDQGTYPAKVSEVGIEDWTQKPDSFGKKGHHTFVYKWLLIGQTDEDGQPIELVEYVKFVTGSIPYTKGARAGKLPKLTEITRAFGEPDLEPGQAFDPETHVGKKAKLGVLESFDADGNRKNNINSHSKYEPKPKTAKPAPKPVADDEDEDDETVPF